MLFLKIEIYTGLIPIKQFLNKMFFLRSRIFFHNLKPSLLIKNPILFRKPSTKVLTSSIVITPAFLYAYHQPKSVKIQTKPVIQHISDALPLNIVPLEEEETKEQAVSVWSFILGIVKRIYSVFRTWLRFCHLVVYFAPVVITSPMMFIPYLSKLWYSLLVWEVHNAGPVFIKLGQWASTRPDLFPPALIKRLSTLQAKVKNEKVKYSKKEIENQLNSKITDIFSEFNENTIGSGCIASVYKAKLVSTGEDVAVKVLRKNIREIVNRDLYIMYTCACILDYLPYMGVLNLPNMCIQFSKTMLSQCDLRNEANNLEKFRENFIGDKTISFPKPYTGYCTETVLVESFEKGQLLSNYLRNIPSKYDVTISNAGLRGYLKMLLVDNFVHGDLHPGNIIIRIDKETNQPHLSVIDAGIVFSLASTQRKNFIDLFVKLDEGDGYGCGVLLIERKPPDSCPVIDPVGFCEEMQRISDECKEDEKFVISKIQIAAVLSQVMTSCCKHSVTLDSKFVNLFTSIILLEGVGRQLNKDLEIFGSAGAYLMGMKKEYRPLAPQIVKEAAQTQEDEDDLVELNSFCSFF